MGERTPGWVYATAAVLLALGAAGAFNFFASGDARILGGTLGNALLLLAPGLLTAGVLTLWTGRLANSDASGDDLRVLSKRFGWVSLVMIFVVPILAMVAVPGNPEATWIYIFAPSYLSAGAGLAVLIFSGVLSHIAKHRDS